MRRARFVFTGLYLIVAAGYLYVDPYAGWTWFIIAAGAALCLFFWGLVGFWSHVFTQGRRSDEAGGTGHG